jgi:dTDP-4-amino-4,6-dideoxygalactose transaminase
VKTRFADPILVTRPYLPPLEEYKRGLEEVWGNQWLTNNGPLLRRFQSGLSEYLGIHEQNLSLFSNGTLALEIIFHAMGFCGYEVITTPFTFVATSHALRRVGAIPVFADIDPVTLCLDPKSVEKLITPRTRAIVPVHVYGCPCDVVRFDRMAQEYGLKVVYDAAHAFGVKVGGRSIAEYGDASMFSFHATKLFHSIEGGLLVVKDRSLQMKVDQLKNFAIVSETECVDVGTNAKMNELQALMGLLNLKVADELIAHRKAIYEAYQAVFRESCSVELLARPETAYGLSVGHNYAYCPVLLGDFETRERTYADLMQYNVFSRRYFYPLLTDFAPYADSRKPLPVSEDSASRVLTLPTYHGLALDEVKTIAQLVMQIAVPHAQAHSSERPPHG